MQSMSAHVSTAPVMGEWRVPLIGCACNSGVAWICSRRSGEQFKRVHVRVSPEIATCVCVRWRTRIPWTVVFDLAAKQFAQLQFHCGKPPPAAEPSTFIFTRLSELRYGIRVDLAA